MTSRSLGETGAGKTLFLNAIVNRIFGVGLEDDVRLHLKDQMDAEEKSTTKSQTEYTTAYTIYHQAGMRHGCNFMIIDTPGFHDTEGIDVDNTLCLRFYLAEETWISHLNGVGVFFKVSDNRCTEEKKETVQNIKDLLGFDIKYLIDIMVTFCERYPTNTIAVVKEEGLQYNEVFQFDNSYIYDILPEDEDEKNDLAHSWRKLTKMQDKYLETLALRKPMSLNITRNLMETLAIAEDTEKKLDSLGKEKKDMNETLKILKRKIAQIEKEANKVDMTKIDEMRNSERFITTDNNKHAHYCFTCEKVCLLECSSSHRLSLWKNQCDNTGKGLWYNTKGVIKKFTNDVANVESTDKIAVIGIVGGVVTLGAILAAPLGAGIATAAAVAEGVGWTSLVGSTTVAGAALGKMKMNEAATYWMHQNDGEKECPHCGHWGLDHYIIYTFKIKDTSVATLVEQLKKEQFQSVLGKTKDFQNQIFNIEQRLKKIEDTEKQERVKKEKANKEKKFLNSGERRSID